MADIKLRAKFSEDEIQRYKNIDDKLPERSGNFDENGLRYPVDALNRLGNRVIFFPLEEMAEFVDLKSKNQIDSKNIEWATKILETTHERIEEYYQTMNASEIGNLAYGALHHEDTNVKRSCMWILEEIYELEQSKL